MEADDDPEKRIRELERELADLQQTPYEASPYTGDARYAGAPSYDQSYAPPYQPPLGHV